MAWTWDHPTGVYKNHALSKDIRYSALARTFFPRFMRPERGYGKGKGESVTITRVLQLAKAARINEIDGIPSVTPDISTVAATVAPWGIQIESTEFENDLAHFNLRSAHQQLLRDNIQLTLDALGAEVLVSTPVKFIPTSGGGVFDTDGTASTTATANITVAQLRKIKDDLARRKVPPFDNGRYVACFTVTGARGIRSDSEAKDWLAPTSAMAFKRGSVGADSGVPTGTTPMAEYLGYIDNVDIYETNNTDVLRDGVGSGSVLGEGVVFGKDASFLAQVMAPELRAELPMQLGTKRAVGWVGTMEGGLVWPEATYARCVHVTSA